MRILLLLVVLPLLLCGLACGSSPEVVITVDNPSDFPRATETIALSWQAILAGNPAILPTAVSVWDASGEIPSQIVDLNADGVPEEILFQSGFAAKEQKTFRVKAQSSHTEFPPRVDARFVLPREDLAWENDRVAFRMYGPAMAADVRNGIDVWTKRVRSLIVQKWYKESEGAPPGKDTYHVDRGEGADFFSVGKTLGAGGCGLWKDNVLHQPGVFTSYQVLMNGPIRAQFKLVYDNGQINGVPFRAEQTVTLDAGEHFNRIDVVYTGAGDSLVVAAGLVKRKNAVATSNADLGWLALWGPVNDDPVNESLGTGVVMPGASAGEDSLQVLLLAPSTAGATLTYYAGAGWTRSGDFGNAQDWEAALAGLANRLRQPLKIAVSAGN